MLMHTLGPKYFYSTLAFVGWFYGAVLLIKIQLVDEILLLFLQINREGLYKMWWDDYTGVSSSLTCPHQQQYWQWKEVSQWCFRSQKWALALRGKSDVLVFCFFLNLFNQSGVFKVWEDQSSQLTQEKMFNLKWDNTRLFHLRDSVIRR